MWNKECDILYAAYTMPHAEFVGIFLSRYDSYDKESELKISHKDLRRSNVKRHELALLSYVDI